MATVDIPQVCVSCGEPAFACSSVCLTCKEIILAIDDHRVPHTITDETLAALRAAAVGVSVHADIPFEDCEGRLWNGTGSHPEWREGNIPCIDYANPTFPPTCYCCGEKIQDEPISFRYPSMPKLVLWRKVSIHRHACTRREVT